MYYSEKLCPPPGSRSVLKSIHCLCCISSPPLVELLAAHSSCKNSQGRRNCGFRLDRRVGRPPLLLPQSTRAAKTDIVTRRRVASRVQQTQTCSQNNSSRQRCDSPILPSPSLDC